MQITDIHVPQIIDLSQYTTIREVMGGRFATAAALFLEYTACRLETLERGLEESRPAAMLLPTVRAIKENATAIGARGLAVIAQLFELTLEDAEDDLSPLAFPMLLEDLRECFEQTRFYFSTRCEQSFFQESHYAH